MPGLKQVEMLNCNPIFSRVKAILLDFCKKRKFERAVWRHIYTVLHYNHQITYHGESLS